MTRDCGIFDVPIKRASEFRHPSKADALTESSWREVAEDYLIISANSVSCPVRMTDLHWERERGPSKWEIVRIYQGLKTAFRGTDDARALHIRGSSRLFS